MGLFCLDGLKKVVLRLIEIIVILSTGLLFTLNILRPILRELRNSIYGKRMGKLVWSFLYFICLILVDCWFVYI